MIDPSVIIIINLVVCWILELLNPIGVRKLSKLFKFFAKAKICIGILKRLFFQ